MAIPFYALRDNFNDDSIDHVTWYTQVAAGTVLETASELWITTSHPGASSQLLGTNAQYNLINTSVAVKVVDAGNQALATYYVLPVHVYAGTFQAYTRQFGWEISGGSIYAFSGAHTNHLASSVYNSAVHKYFRVRESAGRLYWEYATDGITWFALYSATYASLGFSDSDIQNLWFEINVNTSGSEASDTTAKFDDVNVFPITTGSNQPAVTDNFEPILDDSVGRLGCAEAEAFITGTCGFPTVCVPYDISEMHWERRLDDVSAAFITIPIGGDESIACCECLADLEPWCHELHITRNGNEVWCGPITQIIYSYNKVTINAVDNVGWLGMKIPAVETNFTAVNTNLTTIAFGDSDSILNVAFAETQTCILDDVQTYPNSVSGKRKYPAFGATSLEYFNDLSQTGMNYTTLGRSIVLSGEIDQLLPLVILRDESILGEVEVTKDGLLAGNRWYVHYSGDGGTPAVYSGAQTYCYGRLEHLRTEDTVTTAADAQIVAQDYVNAAQIAPRSIVVPPGSRLSPEAPWPITKMVCGARVDVHLSKLCFEVEQSFILSQMNVDYNPNDGEQVTITLSPINSVGL